WRWSTTAQTASVLMIAVFFLVLARSVRRTEIQTWVHAWLGNLFALVITSVLWIGQPTSQAILVPIRIGYFFSKTIFVALLALGAWRFIRPWLRASVTRHVLLAVAVHALVGGLLVQSIDLLGVVQSGLMGAILAFTAGLLVATRIPG